MLPFRRTAKRNADPPPGLLLKLLPTVKRKDRCTNDDHKMNEDLNRQLRSQVFATNQSHQWGKHSQENGGEGDQTKYVDQTELSRTVFVGD